jgi:hypothetical protein
MITLAKGMIGFAVLSVAGLAGIGALTNSRPHSPAGIVAERFVFTAGNIQAPVGEGVDLTNARRDAASALAAIMLPMDAMAPKGDRLNVKPTCGTDCVVMPNGTRRGVHYLTIERMTGPSSSEARRIATTDVASR